MLIVEIEKLANSAHRNTLINNPPDGYQVPSGWISVPENLEAEVIPALPFIDLQIEDGVLVGITPTERPEPEPEPYVPTTEERISALEAAMLAMMGVQSDV